MATTKTYRIEILGKPTTPLATWAEVEALIRSHPHVDTARALSDIEKHGWFSFAAITVAESPYECRRCHNAVVTNENEEECEACLALPRCKNCSDLAEPNSVVCKDCGARCDECRKRFKGEEETILLESDHDAFYYHVRCCGPVAMKIATNEYEPARFRAAAVAGIEKWVLSAKRDLLAEVVR